MTPDETQTQAPEPERPRPVGPPARLPLVRFRKPKKQESFGVVESSKNRKAAKLHVTVWPEGAGNPFPVDVEPDDHGVFFLDAKRLVGPYRIRPGTVLHEDGKYRASVKEGHYETLDPRDLGKGPHPRTMSGLMGAEIIAEIQGLTKRGMPGWQKAGLLGMGAMALLFAGLIVWAIISIGGDIDGVRDAVEHLAQSQVRSPATPGVAAGHQPISPGGT